jgi:enamine deaminase RidA (YjgF/YER057c/UK114 family)
MMNRAARSLTDWPGFMNSALPKISQPVSSDAALSRIKGVLPTVAARSDLICMGRGLYCCRDLFRGPGRRTQAMGTPRRWGTEGITNHKGARCRMAAQHYCAAVEFCGSTLHPQRNPLVKGRSMTKKAIYARGSRASAEQIKISPGLISGNHVFLTGMTGSSPDGSMPQDAEQQIRHAFDKIGAILQAAGLTHAAIVEMTSYHIGLRAHFDLFNTIRSEYVQEPYPAWTAVEVAGLRREGAIVEIRVIAAIE